MQSALEVKFARPDGAACFLFFLFYQGEIGDCPSGEGGPTGKHAVLWRKSLQIQRA